MTLVFGTDPEMFAKYSKDNKDFVLPPAWFRKYGKIQVMDEDSKHPIFLDAMDEHGVMVIEDGVAFEQTILPDTDWRNLFNRIQVGKELLSHFILSKFPKDCDREVATIPTINYDVERWQTEGKKDELFEMCFIFGCDRDYDAEDPLYQSPVIDALTHPYRYGGGHIHVSGSKFIKDEPILAIQCLKLTAGLAAVAFSDMPEEDKLRTFLYGRPTKYRPQKYRKLFNGIPDTDFGVEYRTPSNRWTHSFEHAEQVFKWITIGIENLLETGLGLKLIPEIGMMASKAIVECNQPKAKELLSYVESRI